MKVHMTRTVTIVGGAQDNPATNDVTYNVDAEYDVSDAVGKSLVECGQAVALDTADATETPSEEPAKEGIVAEVEGEAKALLAAFENKKVG